MSLVGTLLRIGGMGVSGGFQDTADTHKKQSPLQPPSGSGPLAPFHYWCDPLPSLG